MGETLPPSVTINGFADDRVNHVVSFSAMLMDGRGSINLNVPVPTDAPKKDADPAKTALKTALKEQFDLLAAAIDDFA